MKPNDQNQKLFYGGTHRHQELAYESQQWWQTDHLWS